MKKLIFLLFLFPLVCFADDFYSITDIYDFSLYLSRNFTYKSDTVDYYQSVKETLELKTYDCEDMAYLTYNWLNKNGYKADMYFIITKEGGHEITCFTKNNKVWIFSNTDLIPTDNEFLILAIRSSFNGVTYIAKQDTYKEGKNNWWTRGHSRTKIWEK